MKVNVYTDGGSRGNPGISGIGAYLLDEDSQRLDEIYEYTGIKTNNEAEYLGAKMGIKRAIELGANEIHLFMDSRLVINQLDGQWKIKKPELQKYCIDIHKLLDVHCIKITYHWIRREENKHADRLSNKAMDEG